MNLIYFNNAATTWPKPKSVINNVNTSFNLPFHEHGRSTIKNLNNYPKLLRELLAKFFNSENTKNFQFTSNATDSLNMLIHGFVNHSKKKIHVITSELEHNSVLRPLKTLKKNKRISLSIVPFDEKGYVSLDNIKKNIKKNTKLIVLNHGSNVLGSVQDINKIGDYLSKKNIFFIVDCAQTAGHLKIDLSKLNVDALAFTGHKSLFGYPGIGFFYIKDPSLVDSFKQGGTGVISEHPYHPQEMPLKYEAGTLNYPGIVSLYEGIKFLKRKSLTEIKKKTRIMIRYIIKELSKEKNIILYNQNPELPIISFNIENLDNEDVGFILVKQFNIMTRTGLHCAPLVHKKRNNGKGCVRLSLSYFNTMNECRKVVKAIKIIATNSNNL